MKSQRISKKAKTIFYKVALAWDLRNHVRAICVPKAFKTFKEWWDKTKKPEVAEKAKTIILQKLREAR